LPRLKNESAQAWTLNELANSYSLSGQPRRAVALFELQNALQEKMGNKKNLAVGLGNVAQQQLVIGALSAAERNLRRRIELCREIEDEFWEAVGRCYLVQVYAYMGDWEKSEQEAIESLKITEKISHFQNQGITWSYRALRFLLLGRQTVDDRPSSIAHYQSAIQSAQRALELADETARTSFPYPRDYVRAHWLLGAA